MKLVWSSAMKKLRKDDTKLSKVIPVQEIGNVLEMKDGTFKRVLRVKDPINSDLLSTHELREAIDALRGSLNAVGTDDTVQWLISSDRVDMNEYFTYLEEKAAKAKAEGDEERARQILSKRNYLTDHAHKSRNMHQFFVTVESRLKGKQAVDQLENRVATFKEKFEEGDMTIEPLEQKEVERVLYEKLSPITRYSQPFDPEMDLTRWQPPDIIDRGTYLEIDGMNYGIYTLTYIQRKVPVAWLKSIFNIRAELDASITMRAIDKGDLVDEVNGKIMTLEEKLASKLQPALVRKYEKQKKSLEKMLDDIQDESENLFATTIILAVRAKTVEELRSASTSLESEVKASRMRAKRLRHKGPYLMWYLLPIGFNNPNLENKIAWQIPAQTLASILPFNSSELNMQEGILKGFNARNESPVIYDRYNDDVFDNPNEVVLGSSGSGKSFYVKVAIHREATEGNANRQFVIDPEREYLFGSRAIFKIGAGYVTNPFHIRSCYVDSDTDQADEMDLENYLGYKVVQMISFFRWIRPSMNELEEALLLEAIQQAYAGAGYSPDENWAGAEFYEQDGIMRVRFHDPFPTLKDLDRELAKFSEMEMMRAALKPYTDGVYSSMFCGQTNWTLHDRINVLDIHELSESVQRPLMDLLIKDIWEEIKIDRREKKGFIVDEAWLLADEKNQQSMEFLRLVAKRIRKYNGFLTCATQNVDDFLSTGKYGGAIVKNAYIKTLMRMDDKDIEELSRFMSFSDRELKVMRKSKGRGYCIHVTGQKRIEMKTDASPDEFRSLSLLKEGSKKVLA